ncbi:MAG TPA: DUF4126 family protein [Candidatus Acidoferrum sp.]|jgi:uncharacterized membrane protein
MTPAEIFLLAFLIGVIAGLRAMTAPAVTSWAAHHAWLNLHNTPLAFMGSAAASIVFILLAVFEFVTDTLPSTPSRTKPVGLIARILTGGISGAAIAAAGGQSIAIGAVLGAVGGVAGAFAGYQVRTRLVKALRVPDIVIAILEDVVAVGGGLLIVSRF